MGDISQVDQALSRADCILLLSGGIDSTTLLAKLVDEGRTPLCMIFDYGQTLKREISVARANAREYGVPYLTLFAPLNFLPGNCSILAATDAHVATGRTLEQINAGTPSSYVPFRNGIFLAYAVAYAEGAGITDIYCGGNGLNSGQYPDDTAEFADAFQQAARLGTHRGYVPTINLPFSMIEKREIVELGRSLGVVYSRTWSCYKNGDNHCGECDSCLQRAIALGE